MRQDAEEKKALKAKRKNRTEDSKYKTQIAALTKQADSAEGSKLDALKARILELQSQLANVVVKKEEISKLQNGKAGNGLLNCSREIPTIAVFRYGRI